MLSFRKFIVKTILIIGTLVILDMIVGKSIIWMSLHAKSGDYGKNRYVCFQSLERCLIFGSSRAHYHYNTSVIKDSLGLSCFNCGRDGAGIIQNYAKLKIIKKRYNPKLIIYDAFPPVDILTHSDNHRDLDLLRLYADEEIIRDIIVEVDNSEKIKMISNLYRVNGKFHNIIKDYLVVSQLNETNGFYANNSSMDYLKIANPPKYRLMYDSLKIHFMEEFIKECFPAKVVISISPIWYGMNQDELTPLKDLCAKYNVALVNFSDSPSYLHNDKLFYDGAHLNAKGANYFSRDLVKKIKRLK